MRPKSICRGQLYLAGNSGKSDMEGMGSSLGPNAESRDQTCTAGLSIRK